MKVRELLELLGACDREAEVTLMVQPHYPHEHRLSGVALREDCVAESSVRDNEAGTQPRDVLLVEGAWLRYGNHSAWDAARRPTR
jgi:hypothetical protein